MRQLLPFAIAALPAIIVGLRATAPGIPQGTALLISLLAMPLGYLAVNGNPSTLSIIFSALIGLGALGAWVTSLVTDVGARNRAWIAVHILSAIVMIALLASGTGPSESVTENVMGGLSTGVLLSWIWTATLTAAVTFTRPRQARLGAGST